VRLWPFHPDRSLIGDRQYPCKCAPESFFHCRPRYSPGRMPVVKAKAKHVRDISLITQHSRLDCGAWTRGFPFENVALGFRLLGRDGASVLCGIVLAPKPAARSSRRFGSRGKGRRKSSAQSSCPHSFSQAAAPFCAVHPAMLLQHGGGLHENKACCDHMATLTCAKRPCGYNMEGYCTNTRHVATTWAVCTVQIARVAITWRGRTASYAVRRPPRRVDSAPATYTGCRWVTGSQCRLPPQSARWRARRRRRCTIALCRLSGVRERRPRAVRTGTRHWRDMNGRLPEISELAGFVNCEVYEPAAVPAFNRNCVLLDVLPASGTQ